MVAAVGLLLFAGFASASRSVAADTPQTVWELRDPGTTVNLLGAASGMLTPTGPARTVIVGENGTILATDDDGVNWTRCNSGTTETLTAASAHEFGGPATPLFTVVGTHGTILTSADGLHWTKEVSPTSLRLNAVCGDLAVGEAGVGLLVRDDNGLWRQLDLGFTACDMYAVSYYYACGAHGVFFRGGSTTEPWQPVPTGTTSDLRAYDAAADLLVGANGFGIEGTTATLNAVTSRIGTSFALVSNGLINVIGERLAIGSDGTILRRAFPAGLKARYAGWVQDQSPTHATLRAITNARGTIIVGDRGTVLVHPPVPPVLTQELHLDYGADGVPYIEGEATTDGAWSYGWVQIGLGSPWPIGFDLPRQSLAQPRWGILGPGFRLIVANAFGAQFFDIATNHLANLSARARVGSGEAGLIAGFTVSTGWKHLLIRGIGPSLSRFGVTDPVRVPRLTLYQGSTEIPLPAPDQGSFAGAFPLPPGSGDVAYTVLITQPGNYTVKLESGDGQPGTALLELYDQDPPTTRPLSNLSARANVSAGQDVVIGGLTVAGALKGNYLFRAAGPALRDFGIKNPLSRPQLTLYRGAAALRSSATGGWTAEPDLARADAAAQQVQAFQFADGSSDAAFVAELTEGAYTAVISSGSGQPGVALFEVYAVR